MGIKNQKGQIAIFVALIFQVLFVLFAMSINVALVVHDKINLQNAVDLAAYYGAQRQAEILNAIAHNNYQIRQAWKLLSWRYRVLGTMGMANHPTISGGLTDTLYPEAEEPGVCMTYSPVFQDAGNDVQTLCKTQGNVITQLKVLDVNAIAAAVNPFNNVLRLLTQQYVNNFNQSCNQHGAANWLAAASMMAAFKFDQASRKSTIYRLASQLGFINFKEINGDPVRIGIENTVAKNLTRTNLKTLQGVDIYNSLSGNSPEKWLPLIRIVPEINYTDVKVGGGCISNERTKVTTLPARPEGKDLVKSVDVDGRLMATVNAANNTSPLAASLGVEKNPWYVAYVGVKARSAPRQLFFPVGQGVVMEARAFAKPFGGRIGPWYSDSWAKGAPGSDGAKVDLQVPPRSLVSGSVVIGDDRNLPNYSRYPGDALGLKSRLGQAHLKNQRSVKYKFLYYSKISGPLDTSGANDYLAYSATDPMHTKLRDYEIAAIAPDLFDITYYSIDHDYLSNYYSKIYNNRIKFAGAFDFYDNNTFIFRTDLGSREPNPGQPFTIKNQYTIAQPIHADAAFYFVKELSHLFTGWIGSDKVGVYGPPNEKFANCDKAMLEGGAYAVPGCPTGGGRTGYSVKLVSKDALAREHTWAGPNSGSSTIENPPENF